MPEVDRERIRQEMFERLLEDLLHVDTKAYIPEISGHMSLEEFTQKYGSLDLAGTLQRRFASRNGSVLDDSEVSENMRSLVSRLDELHWAELENRLYESLKSMDFSVIEQWHDALVSFAKDAKGKKEVFEKAVEEFDRQHLKRDFTP